MLRLLRSTSVRLALGYAALFVVSSLLLVGLLWWATAGYLERETAAVIHADLEAIQDDLPSRGLTGAIETVRDRVAAATDGHAVYLLADRSLKPVIGNLPAWPSELTPQPGRYQIPLVLDGRLRRMQIEEATLPEGYRLLVGRDIQDRAEIRALIVEGLGWATMGAFIIAVVGGLLVRRAVLRRVEIINRAATAIVHGDLSQRLPTRDTSDEFDQLAQMINLMLQQIENLIESIRNTSNAVAHDLRTPLAELRARLEELTRIRPTRDGLIEGIQEAVADIDRVIGIFNALLRLVEIDSGVRRSGFRRVDLVEIATEVAELYGPLAEEKRAAFVVDVDDELSVNGDPHLIAQAVGNLVDNAVKFAPCNSAVSLRIGRRDDAGIDIAVADEGPGIPDAEKPRVTQRFYRCEASCRTAGLGLGLSLVEAVARLHDGSFTLSDNNPGLTASLKLPAGPQMQKDDTATE